MLTNSALIDREDVREELALADFVVAKLDAPSQELLEMINQPDISIRFENIIAGLKSFRKMYNKKLALQIMLIEQNKHEADALIELVNMIKPDEVQLNTPLRKCGIKPLSKKEILEIKSNFVSKCADKIHIVSVYDEVTHPETTSISDADTLKRRGKTKL